MTPMAHIPLELDIKSKLLLCRMLYKGFWNPECWASRTTESEPTFKNMPKLIPFMLLFKNNFLNFKNLKAGIDLLILHPFAIRVLQHIQANLCYFEILFQQSHIPFISSIVFSLLKWQWAPNLPCKNRELRNTTYISDTKNNRRKWTCEWQNMEISYPSYFRSGKRNDKSEVKQ